MKGINRARRLQTLPKVFGPQAQYCRALPCMVCLSPPPSDPAHVRSRGAGGKDMANVVPLCRMHHQEQHARGIVTFQQDHNIDMEQVARDIASHMQREG